MPDITRRNGTLGALGAVALIGLSSCGDGDCHGCFIHGPTGCWRLRCPSAWWPVISQQWLQLHRHDQRNRQWSSAQSRHAEDLPCQRSVVLCRTGAERGRQ